MPQQFQSKFLPFNPVVSRRDPSIFKGNPFGINMDPTRRGLIDPTLGNPKELFPEQEGNPYSIQSGTEPQAKRPSLAEQYAKIAGDRPNRMAYQQSVEQGAPQIQRGKWAKLGAAIAAGGSALGGMPADRASALGLSSYYEPQRRSDEAYDKKNTGLGRLAQFEDSDIQEKLKVMEMENEDRYRDKAEGRADAAETRAQAAEGRAVDIHGKNLQMTDLQFKKIKQEIAKAGETTWLDKATGWTWTEDENGQIKGHKTDLTPTEAAEAAGKKAAAESNAKQANEIAQIHETSAGGLAIANARGDSAEETQRIKNEGTAANLATRLEKSAAGLKPGDKYKQALIDVAAAVRADNTLAGSNLLTKDQMGMPMVTPDNWYDSDAVTASKEKLRKILSDALKKASAGPKIKTAPPPAAADPAAAAPGTKGDPLGIRGGL